METGNDYINDILALHFTGEKLSDNQEKKLLNWIWYNQEEYEKLSTIFQAAGSASDHSMNFDREKAWTVIQNRLNKQQTSQQLPEEQPLVKSYQLGRIGRYMSYAACILAIVGVSTFYLTKHGNDEHLYTNTTQTLLSVLLPDSSSVVLYPQAKVSYIADAKSQKRKTELEGQAFFKVKADKTRPFQVAANGTLVQVLGTSFLVNSTDVEETGIFVREGVVQVSTESQEVILKANEQARVEQGTIQKMAITNPEDVFHNHIKQKTYQDTPISQVFKDIENEFKVRLTADDSLLKNRISTTLKFINLEDILSEISYICNFKYRNVSEKEYEFYKP